MMKKRGYLLPISWIYGAIMRIRNLFYQWGVFRSHSFDLPIICVGNLSVGGTGKSPMIMYLIEILKDEYMICTLSRGYGRSSKGFRLANYDSTAKEIGDEPLQFFNRYKNQIIITVSEDRVKGAQIAIKELNPDLILLDDAYQHRKIKPGFNFLLTQYSDLYSSDYVLPAGGLREPRIGFKRADIIIVTKCPEDLQESKRKEIRKKLRIKSHQTLLFSKIQYSALVCKDKKEISPRDWNQYHVSLVTGIANPKPIKTFVEESFKSIQHFDFKDHHPYSHEDVDAILKKHLTLPEPKILVTTEKDYAKLKEYKELEQTIYYLSISLELDQPEELKQKVLHYVRKNQKSSK